MLELVLVALLLALREVGEARLDTRDVDGSVPRRRTVEYGCFPRRDVRVVVACDVEWSAPEEYLEVGFVLELAVRLVAERELVAVRVVFTVRELPAFRVVAVVDNPLAFRVLDATRLFGLERPLVVAVRAPVRVDVRVVVRALEPSLVVRSRREAVGFVVA